MMLTGSRVYTRAVPVPKMPPGLVELMEGLTKDVLKNNPSNVYEFCTNHLEKLLEMRDGPSSYKSLTLEEKIAKAQEKVQQRAKERRQLYDLEIESCLRRDVSENIDTGAERNLIEQKLVSNLRAPVHHDQDLSLSSEVEISQELTDNSLTSKDSYYEEPDEIPISKSSTLSSVSKSTVIDLTTGNDYETMTKEDIDHGFDTIEKTKTKPIKDLRSQNQENECEIVDKQKDVIAIDKHIDLVNSDTNNEPVTGTENLDEQNDVGKNNEQSSNENDKKQEHIESLLTENSNQPVATEKSAPAVIISDEDSSAQKLDNLIEAQLFTTGIVVKSKNEHGLNIKSVEEDNAIIEEDITLTNQIEPSQADLSVEVIKTDDENSTLTTANEITVDCLNEIVSTDNGEDKKYTRVQVIEFESTMKNTAAVSLKESVQPESDIDKANLITNLNTVVDSPTKNLNKSQTDKTNSNVIDSDVKVAVDETKGERKLVPGHEKHETIKNIITCTEHVVTTKNTQNILNLEDNQNTNNDSNEKHIIIFSDTEEKVNKEDNATSYSTSLQTPSSSENNDDSIMGLDYSKADDDIHRSDESGQNNMNLETAAVTIQKVFRSFLFKSRNSTFEDITNDDALEEENDKNKEVYYATANLNKERRPLGITRMDTVLQTVNEEKSLSLSTDDSSTLSSAATTIQAHVRGFLVRNKLNSYRTVSTNSLVNSNEMLDNDAEQNKNKTVLNIHIVPEEGNYLSRDESLITSMELSLDGSPPSSVNLHPLSYDLVSERRKLLKREDAIQSVSPPSNNSGKLSEDSVKEVINEKTESNMTEKGQPEINSPDTLVNAVAIVPVHDMCELVDSEITAEKHKTSASCDESDVITPFVTSPRSLVGDFENTSKLMHSGEFHDVVLPTKVSRSDTTVVRGE